MNVKFFDTSGKQLGEWKNYNNPLPEKGDNVNISQTYYSYSHKVIRRIFHEKSIHFIVEGDYSLN